RRPRARGHAGEGPCGDGPPRRPGPRQRRPVRLGDPARRHAGLRPVHRVQPRRDRPPVPAGIRLHDRPGHHRTAHPGTRPDAQRPGSERMTDDKPTLAQLATEEAILKALADRIDARLKAVKAYTQGVMDKFKEETGAPVGTIKAKLPDG